MFFRCFLSLNLKTVHEKTFSIAHTKKRRQASLHKNKSLNFSLSWRLDVMTLRMLKLQEEKRKEEKEEVRNIDVQQNRKKESRYSVVVVLVVVMVVVKMVVVMVVV